jgi:hypothetical protein
MLQGYKGSNPYYQDMDGYTGETKSEDTED